MKLYFDMCALKRPWDEQAQRRIQVETAAVVLLMRAVREGKAVALRSPAHDLENQRNPDANRAAAVQEWLERIPLPVSGTESVARRAGILVGERFRPFDALHVAWAEYLGADGFVTTDDRLIRLATRVKVCTRLATPDRMVVEVFR